MRDLSTSQAQSDAQRPEASPGRSALLKRLTLFLVGLQVADGISTYLALSTGHAEEKNQLLLDISAASGVSVVATVLGAKVVCASFFLFAMPRTKPTSTNIVVLSLLTAYVSLVVAQNFFWAWFLS